MTDIVTPAGPSAHARVAVVTGSTRHSVVWGAGAAIARLEDRTDVALVSSTGDGAYVGVVHGLTEPDPSVGYTVAAAIVAGFACIAIKRGTLNEWAPGSKVYCDHGTQAVSNTDTAQNTLVGFVVPGPPRIMVGEHDYLDILVAR
jgi:hypothetical protein